MTAECDLLLGQPVPSRRTMFERMAPRQVTFDWQADLESHDIERSESTFSSDAIIRARLLRKGIPRWPLIRGVVRHLTI